MSNGARRISVNNTTWQTTVGRVQTNANVVRATVRHDITNTRRKQLRRVVGLTTELNGLVAEYLGLVRQDVLKLRQAGNRAVDRDQALGRNIRGNRNG